TSLAPSSVGASFSRAYVGKLEAAQAVAQRAVELARQDDLQELGSLVQILSVLPQAEYINVGNVRRVVSSALTLSPNSTDTKKLAALAVARIGQTNKALAIVQGLQLGPLG